MTLRVEFRYGASYAWQAWKIGLSETDAEAEAAFIDAQGFYFDVEGIRRNDQEVRVVLE